MPFRFVYFTVRVGAIALAINFAGSCAADEVANPGVKTDDAGKRASQPKTAALPGKGSNSFTKKTVDAVVPDLAEDQVMFQYMLSEIANQRDNPLLATRSLIELARKTRDGRIARRAAELAFQARLQSEARVALLAWLEVEPDAASARQGLALLLGSYPRSESTETLNAQPSLTLAALLLSDWLTDARTAPTLLPELPGLMARYGERDDVYKAVRKLVQGHLPRAEANFAIAQAARQANLRSEALVAIDMALKASPVWTRGVLLKADILRMAQAKPAEGLSKAEPLAIDNDRAAGRYLEGFLREHPDAAEIRVAYARVLVGEKAYLSAREQFRQAAKSMPEDVELVYALGLISQQIEDFADAQVHYKRTLELKPRDVNPIYFNLAGVSEATRDIDGALAWYRKIGQGEFFVPAQLKSALLLSKRDGLPSGRDFLQRARAADGAPIDQRNQLALAEVQLLREAKAYAEAHALLSALMIEQPTAHDFAYDRAMISEKLGRLDDMERDLRLVIALKPDHAHAYNALGYTFVERGVRLDEAEVLINSALAITPNDAFIQDSMGWLRFKQGKLDDALALLQKAYALRADPEIALHLGEVLWVRGDKEAATRLLRIALIESPGNEALTLALKRFQP